MKKLLAAILSVALVLEPVAAFAQSGSGNGVAASIQPSQNNIGNVGGKTVKVCKSMATSATTPTITASNSYGTNYVVGGLLQFTGLYTSTGSGLKVTVTVTINNKVETNGFTYRAFSANPSNTTWTDAQAAAIAVADGNLPGVPVSLTSDNTLGTQTTAWASPVSIGNAPGTTFEYGVLTTNSALTNQFDSSTIVQVCLVEIDDL